MVKKTYITPLIVVDTIELEESISAGRLLSLVKHLASQPLKLRASKVLMLWRLAMMRILI